VTGVEQKNTSASISALVLCSPDGTKGNVIL